MAPRSSQRLRERKKVTYKGFSYDAKPVWMSSQEHRAAGKAAEAGRAPAESAPKKRKAGKTASGNERSSKRQRKQAQQGEQEEPRGTEQAKQSQGSGRKRKGQAKQGPRKNNGRSAKGSKNGEESGPVGLGVNIGQESLAEGQKQAIRRHEEACREMIEKWRKDKDDADRALEELHYWKTGFYELQRENARLKDAVLSQQSRVSALEREREKGKGREGFLAAAWATLGKGLGKGPTMSPEAFNRLTGLWWEKVGPGLHLFKEEVSGCTFQIRGHEGEGDEDEGVYLSLLRLGSAEEGIPEFARDGSELFVSMSDLPKLFIRMAHGALRHARKE